MPAMAPARKNGASGSRSLFHDNRPRCHQKITGSTAGSITVAVLLSRASTNNPKCSEIPPRLARLVEAQVEEHGAQVENAGEGILQFRDPGHRFHVHRMKCEDRRRQVRAGDRQATQDQRHHQGCRGVQEDVHQVIAERRVAPQLVLDPEGAERQRVVLLRGKDVEPDAV